MLREILATIYELSVPVNMAAAKLYDLLGNWAKLSALITAKGAARQPWFADRIRAVGFAAAIKELFELCEQEAEDDLEEYVFLMYDLQKLGPFASFADKFESATKPR